MLDNRWERLIRLYEQAEEKAEFWKDKDPEVYAEVLAEELALLEQAAELLEAIDTIMAKHKEEEGD